MDIESFIAQRIENLCIKYDISRYELSHKTGISQNALSNIVKKKQIPTILTIEKICEGFSISLSEFFMTPHDVAGLTEEQTNILKYIERMSVDEKRFLMVWLEDLQKMKE